MSVLYISRVFHLELASQFHPIRKSERCGPSVGGVQQQPRGRNDGSSCRFVARWVPAIAVAASSSSNSVVPQTRAAKTSYRHETDRGRRARKDGSAQDSTVTTPTAHSVVNQSE